jgi:hypothetical protein
LGQRGLLFDETRGKNPLAYDTSPINNSFINASKYEHK